MKKQIFAAAACAAVFSSYSYAGVTQLGTTFTPTGANYTITAVQNVDASNPLGQSGSAQVNKDFEFQGTNGVSYDSGSGKLTDFGLGLYQPKGSNATESTGLRIDYNAPVDASTVHVTLLDFDIKAGQDTFFKTQKVEPVLTLLGANNSIIAVANPSQIFSALSPVAQGTAKSDTWDLDFSKVLSNLNLGNQTISGFILSADQQNGEKANSDPYLLISVGNGIPQVPEPASYIAGMFAIGVALSSRWVLRKRQANV